MRTRKSSILRLIYKKTLHHNVSKKQKKALPLFEGQTESLKNFIKKGLNNISLSDAQIRFYTLIRKNKITICQGPAGTAKTFVACYAALKEVIENPRIYEIIFTKPIQESGEKLGFLPGSVADKTDPFRQSYDTNLKKIINSEQYTKDFLNSNLCRFEPLAYMRGATYDNAIMILDEAQNCDARQLELFITRLGKDSKIIIAGDVTQYDIRRDNVGLPETYNLLKGLESQGVGLMEFTSDDIVRNPLLVEISKRYEELKIKKENAGKEAKEQEGNQENKVQGTTDK